MLGKNGSKECLKSKRARFTEEFKREAVSQVIDRENSVGSVGARLGVSTKSLYYCKRRFGVEGKDADELRVLKAELKRVTEERDILAAPAR